MLYESVGADASHSSGPELGFHGFRYVSQWTPYPMKCLWKDCKRELPCRRLLERHVTRHCREASKGKRVCSWRNPCLILPNTFRESLDLIAHVNARHVSFLPWPCPSKDCSKVLNDETALLGHFELIHSTVSRGALRESLNPSSLVLVEPAPLPNHYPTYRLGIPEPLPATFKRVNVVQPPSIKGIDWDGLELDNDATVITKATPMLIRRATANPNHTPPAIFNEASEPPRSFVSPVVSAPRKIGWNSLSEDLETNNYDWSGARVVTSSPSSLVNPTSHLSWPAPRRRALLPPSPPLSTPALLPASAQHFIVNRDMIIQRHMPEVPASGPGSPSSPMPATGDIAATVVMPKARPHLPSSPARLQAISRKHKIGAGNTPEFGHGGEENLLTLLDDGIGAGSYSYTKSDRPLTAGRARKSTRSVFPRIPSPPS